VGVDFSNLLLHVGAWGGGDLIHLSTNGHKVLGLNGKKVIVKIE